MAAMADRRIAQSDDARPGGVGFDASRGDVLTIEDLAFDQNRAQPPIPIARRMVAEAENSPVLAKYAALMVCVLLVLAFGVRPALRLLGQQTWNCRKLKPKTRTENYRLSPGRNQLFQPPSPLRWILNGYEHRRFSNKW